MQIFISLYRIPCMWILCMGFAEHLLKYPYSSWFARYFLLICYSKWRDIRNIDRRLYAAKQSNGTKIKSKYVSPFTNNCQLRTKTKMMQHFHSFIVYSLVWLFGFSIWIHRLLGLWTYSFTSWLAGNVSSDNALNNKNKTCFLCVTLNNNNQ